MKKIVERLVGFFYYWFLEIKINVTFLYDRLQMQKHYNVL